MPQLMQQDRITKIADDLGRNLQMYWDYREQLSEEQVLKIITDEDGLNDVEDELYENNIDYIFEIVTNAIKEYCKENDVKLSDEEFDELRMECEGRFDFNLKGLLNNSSAHIRVHLNSNEDMIPVDDIKHSETAEEFRRRFRNKFRIKDLKQEILNCTTNYANLVFYFKISGDDILKLRDEVQNRFITLRKGLFFGLFDGFNGSGSTLEMELLHPITLNLKDWRLKDDKEAVVQRIEGNNSKYWNIAIVGDNLKKYGIQQVYGLSSWQEY